MDRSNPPDASGGFVVLATCHEARAHDTDLPLLVAAFEARGVPVQVVDWDDETWAWSSARIVVVRSTWDYHRRLDAFLAWVDRVAAVTRLANPAPVLHWNTDKHYLAELAAAGLPVVPTVFIEADDSSWEATVSGWLHRGDVVVKPTVSAGSNDTVRHATIDSARAHGRDLLGRGAGVIVQPYLQRVDTEMETGLVYIDGAFSHGFAKGPMLASPSTMVGGLYLDERIDARTPTPAQRHLGDRVLAWLDQRWGRVLYARVDLLPTEHGPVIVEVELTEPSLYLHLSDTAAPLLVDALVCSIESSQLH